jgi:RNA polymerase sigma-70 factor (ECF subfamily)
MIALAPEPDPTDSDTAVVHRVLGGDVDAFRTLVERYEAAVLRLARGISPRSTGAEDVAQETFVAAFAALSRFDAARGRFDCWLLTIAKNRCLNARRKKSPLPLADPPEPVDDATPEGALSRADVRRRLDAALDALPEDLRSTFVLAEIVGLETDRIAEIERVAPGTIRSRLSRAKARLRADLSPLRGEKP